MVKFKHRYCKVHMAQYLSGELPAATRRRIARFIDECDDCYREYVHQRELANHLQRSLPTFGQPKSPTLGNIWAGIQSELQLSGSAAPHQRRWQPRLSFSYGLVLLSIVLALLMPMLIGHRASEFTGAGESAIDLPPRPQTAQVITTPATPVKNSRFALASTASTRARTQSPLPLLQNTPAAHFRR